MFQYRAIAFSELRVIVYGKIKQMDYAENFQYDFRKVANFKEKDLFLVLQDLTIQLPTYKLIPFEMTWYYLLYCQAHHIETTIVWEDFWHNGEMTMYSLPI